MLGLVILLGLAALALSIAIVLRRRSAGATALGAEDEMPATPDASRVDPGLKAQVDAIMQSLGGGPAEPDAPVAPDETALPVIGSFDAARDVIVVELPGGLTVTPDVALRDDPGGSILTVGGVDIARVRAPRPAAEEAMRLVTSED